MSKGTAHLAGHVSWRDRDAGAPVAGALAIVLTVALYFGPTLVAQRRRRRQADAIFAINLFLGWTLLGWIVALVWAFM